MAELPYVLNTGTLQKLFTTIQTTGQPDKVHLKYLASIGFTSSNDRYLVAFLKDLGFIQSDGTPSDRWGSYRHTGESKAVMAEAVRTAWSGLFSLYEDAPRRDDEAIRNWMRTHAPKASPVTIDRSLKSFRAVADLADFTGGAQATAPAQRAAEAAVATTVPSVPSMPRVATPEVVINIQLQVPATNDPDTYDRFFAAMRKHLFPGESS